MIRECGTTCPFQLGCYEHRKKVDRSIAGVTETKKEALDLLSLGSETLPYVRSSNDYDVEDRFLRVMDMGLDILNNIKENEQQLARIQKGRWVVTALSKVATATCIGTINGACSSPIGFLLSRAD